MGAIDTEKLLREISLQAPCGQNLEYDAAYTELARAAVAKPEQQYGETVIPAVEPDWQDVQRRALEVFTRTKDLRVALHLTAAAAHTAGLEGLRDGLAVTHGLLKDYWDQVHPQLDPADNNDPALRLNALAGLNDPVMLRGVREAFLLTLPGLGRLDVRTLLMAHGLLPMAGGTPLPPVRAEIDAALAAAEPVLRQQLYAASRDALQYVREIGALLAEKVGAERVPELGGVRGLLQQIETVLAVPLAGEAVAASVAGVHQTLARQISTSSIRNRQDVIINLDMICAYYDEWEPSSPVPLLLRRAKQLVSKSFVDIVRDLTPDAMARIELIGGLGAKQPN